eukprot:622376-Hanusia_phi.AAC.1
MKNGPAIINMEILPDGTSAIAEFRTVKEALSATQLQDCVLFFLCESLGHDTPWHMAMFSSPCFAPALNTQSAAESYWNPIRGQQSQSRRWPCLSLQTLIAVQVSFTEDYKPLSDSETWKVMGTGYLGMTLLLMWRKGWDSDGDG